MLGPVKTLAAFAMLVTVQTTVRPPPAVDQLQDAAKAVNEGVGSKVSMELNGCMRDDRNSTAVTCYYKFAKTYTVEVHADAPKGAVQRGMIELPPGKDNARTMAIIAMFLAELLIPTASPQALMDFNKKVEGGFGNAFGGGTTNLGSYGFHYQATDKKTTLNIYSN